MWPSSTIDVSWCAICHWVHRFPSHFCIFSYFFHFCMTCHLHVMFTSCFRLAIFVGQERHVGLGKLGKLVLLGLGWCNRFALFRLAIWHPKSMYFNIHLYILSHKDSCHIISYKFIKTFIHSLFIHDSFVPRRFGSRKQDPHMPQRFVQVKSPHWRSDIPSMPTVSREQSDRAAMGFESTWPCWILVTLAVKMQEIQWKKWRLVIENNPDLNWPVTFPLNFCAEQGTRTLQRLWGNRPQPHHNAHRFQTWLHWLPVRVSTKPMS